VRRILYIVFLLCIANVSFAQKENANDKDTPAPSTDPNTQYTGIGGYIGASIFKGKPYLLLGFNPQFEFGDWGIGIDGAIRIGSDGSLREEDFDELYDYARFLSYVRYGKPWEDFYLRIGGLRNATLGHGSIVDNYSNNSSYDNRRIGAAARLDAGFVGAEGLLSDIFARGFTRPFHLVPVLANSWFFRNLEFGATGSFDFDPDAVRIIPNHPPWVERYIDTVDGKVIDSVVVVKDSAQIASPLNLYGVDASFMVWQDRNAEGRIYGDYVKIIDFNEGFIFGGRASFYTDSFTFWDVRLERHLFKNYFLPNYYNSFYERDKYNDDVSELDYITKATRLADTTTGDGNGSRFGLFARFHRTVEVSMMYAHLDNLPRADLLEVTLTFPEIWWRFFGAISYQRRNIDGPADYFKFDDNTIAGARLSVQPFKFIVLSAVARWTFTRDPETGRTQTQGIIEPKATFIARL
jgi:hypothetical protein